jgi:hypothetical protein
VAEVQPKRIVIPGLIISLVGSIIFLFVTPPTSFALFSLFLLLAAAITMTLLGKTFLLKIPIRGSGIELHVFLMLASVAVLILQLANIYVEAISSTLYVIVFIFALGFSFLSILRFKPSFSRIEFIALTYPLSLASLAIFGTITLVVPSSVKGMILSIMITLLSAVSLFVKIKEKQPEVQKQKQLILKNNELILAITLLTFVVFFIELYPQISRILGFDIAGNFLQALAFTKSTLGSFSTLSALYPLFGIYQSSIIYIVKPSVETFQVTTVFLSIFTILSFYAMASQYLKRYGDHVPAIATLIWSAFSGFGWLNFLSQRIDNPSASLLSLIGQADAFSYGDITWRRLFFYLSMEATFALVFAVLYFLKRKDLSRTKQVLLMTLLITPIPLMHPYGAYLLLLMLLCFAIICTEELRQQLTYSAHSLIIASFASLLLNYILRIEAPGILLNILTFFEYLVTGLAIIAITSMHGKIQRKPAVTIKKLLDNKYTLPIATFLMLLYFASLILWLSNNIAFNFGNLNLFGYVPGFLYPVKLGIMGVLAIIAVYLLLTNSQFRSRELVALLASALLMIIVSRLVSAMQMQYVSTFTFDPNSWLSESIRKLILGFREERMFEVFKIPLAMIASVVLGKYIMTKTKQENIRLSNYVLVTGFVSLILISGMASTFLGFEYYHNLTQTNPLSSSELDMINSMQNSIYTNGMATIIAPQTPASYLDFTGATAIITESSAAWESKSPELPLFVTRYSKTTPTYIYLDKTGDYQDTSTYSGNYLEHISDSAIQTYLENQEVKIEEINNTSIPVPQSTTTLVIPYTESTMAISEPFTSEAYEQNRTLNLFFESDMQAMDFYKEPISYNNVEINNTANFSGDSYIRVNGTDTNFDKISVEFEFQPLELATQVIIGKLDWGTPRRKSWEIAQYGKTIAFKISPDGDKEEVLATGEILVLNTQYIVRCEYDGNSMSIFVNNKIVASQPYQEGIFQSNTDLTVGAELYNDKPTAFAKMILSYVSVLNDVPSATEPSFYAYDLLSATGLNYTTTLSNDNKSDDYETQVLPYDDTITLEMLTNLEANQQTANTTNVIIINANGYGPFLSLFGNMTSESFTASGIFTNSYSAMQPQIDVPVITLNNNTEVKAQYVDNSLSSPFIMTTTRDQLTLIYVNVYPLIQQNQLFNPTPIQTLTEILGNYMEIYDETAVSPWFYEPSLLFSGFEASGTIQVVAELVASIKLQENSAVRTNSGTYYNISTLGTEGYKAIQINSSEITVQGGYGFYTTLIAYNPSITLQNNQTTTIDINGNATFLIRQPVINVSGKIEFEDFFMLHPPTIYTDGRTTTLSGNITLNIYVSDEDTIALPYKFNSPITVKYEEPLMEFDETVSLLAMTPYIVLVVMLATVILLLRRSEQADAQESTARYPLVSKSGQTFIMSKSERASLFRI